MDHEEVGRYLDENAEVWTELVLAGYDHYRDGLNTPAFLAMLPEIHGLSGLDVGCGEGHNTRLLAEREARMVGIDISGNFVRHAREAEERSPLGIRYEVASALELPFEGASFDFAVAFMSLMDIPETEQVLAEVYRVIRPEGVFQFSIEHPCFSPHPATKSASPDAAMAITTERRVRGTWHVTGIPILKASMPVKCIDQIPVPIAKAPPASHAIRARP